MTHDALAPLLRWTLSAEGPVLEPAIKLTRGLVPSLEESATAGLKASVRYALESEFVLGLAKDTVRGAIVSKIHALQEAQRKRDEELRRRMRRKEQGLSEEEGEEEGKGKGPGEGEDRGPGEAAVAPGSEDETEGTRGGAVETTADQGAAADAATQAAMEELRRVRQAAFDKAEHH